MGLLFVKVRGSCRLVVYLKEVRLELTIFIMVFGTYSYFHQGGGWNQNDRFDQV